MEESLQGDIGPAQAQGSSPCGVCRRHKSRVKTEHKPAASQDAPLAPREGLFLLGIKCCVGRFTQTAVTSFA